MAKKTTVKVSKPVQQNELAYVGVFVKSSLNLEVTVNGKLENLEIDEDQFDELEEAIEQARGWR